MDASPAWSPVGVFFVLETRVRFATASFQKRHWTFPVSAVSLPVWIRDNGCLT
jgi:hypothetical protein